MQARCPLSLKGDAQQVFPEAGPLPSTSTQQIQRRTSRPRTQGLCSGSARRPRNILSPFLPPPPAWQSLALSLQPPSIGTRSSACSCPSSRGVAVQFRPVTLQNRPQWVPRVSSRWDPGGGSTAEMPSAAPRGPKERPGGREVLAEDRPSEQRPRGPRGAAAP